MAFLELSSDDVVDPDWAVEAMEHMTAYLQRLGKDGIANLERSLEAISEHGRANGYPNEFLEFLEGLIERAGLADEED